MSPHWDIKKNMPDLTGKVAIVTGGNTGLGKELVRQLATHNAKVYMASRTELRALSAIEELYKDHPELPDGAGIHFLQLNLSDLQSCQTAALTFLDKETRLDILLNNAGIMANPFELTKDGFEIQFQSNHLGHFAFTLPLIPILTATSKLPGTSVRVVQVSSGGHNFVSRKDDIKFDTLESVNRDFDSPWKRYGQSKLANILFMKELSRKLGEERVFCNALHPGDIKTELTRGTAESYPCTKPFIGLVTMFLFTPYKGAITPLYAATAPEIEEKDWRGEFFTPLAKHDKPSELAQDTELAKQLWDFSERMVQEQCSSLV